MRILPIVAVIALSATNCFAHALDGNAVPSKQPRSVAAFTGVEVHAGLTVVARAGAAYRVLVRGDSNLVPHVVTRVQGNRLVIDTDLRDGYSNRLPLVVEVEAPVIDELEAHGGATLTASQIQGSTLRARCSGGAKVEVDGQVSTLLADASGGARILARDLRSSSAQLSGSGGATERVCVTESLRANFSGGSRLVYACNPKTIHPELSGGASMSRE